MTDKKRDIEAEGKGPEFDKAPEMVDKLGLPIDKRTREYRDRFKPDEAPKGGFAVRISDEMWKAIHSDDPASVYAVDPALERTRPDRYWLGYPTPAGPFGSYIGPETHRGGEHCPWCGCKVREIHDRNGAVRCLGCGKGSTYVAPAKTAASVGEAK